MAGKPISPVVHYLHTVLGSGKDGPPDGELLGRYLVGRDPLAFETLVRRHGPVVKGVCRRLLGDGADADDVYQATFLIFARKASGIRKRDSVGSWLFGVAYRLSKQKLTQLDRRHRRETSIGPDTEPLATSADPAQQASLRELAALLDEELMRLPAVCRAALIACHLEGLSAADAARQMGVPASTLKSRLERGRDLLRRRLQRRGIGLSVLAMTVLLGELTKVKAASALVKTTVQTALAFAATGTAPVASPAVALAVQAIQSALMTKVKLGLLVTLTCGVLGVGVVVSTSPSAQKGSSFTGKEKAPAAQPVLVAQQEPPQETLLTAQEIRDLAKKLGDAQFTVRDAATKRLKLMDAAGLEIFRNLDFGSDLETKRRAEDIIKHIEDGINSESVKKVFSDWQKRQEWFESVEYVVEGKNKVPKGAYTDLRFIVGGKKNSPLPDRDLEGEASFSLLLDLAKGRHRRVISEQVFDSNPGKLRPENRSDTFDGSVMKCLIAKEKNPDLKSLGVTMPEMTIVSGNMSNGAFQFPYLPVFFSLGRIHTWEAQILPGQLRKKLPQDVLQLHGKGIHDGRNCLIFRVQGRNTTFRVNGTVTVITYFEEYWADPEREGALVRYRSMMDDRPQLELNIHYQASHGHWLPDAWRLTVYKRDAPLYFQDMRVKEINVNGKLTDGDFVLETKAGMLVEERTDGPTANAGETPASTINVYRLNKTQVPDPYGRKGDTYPKSVPTK